MRWVLVFLSLLAGCDKVRALPGVEPRSAREPAPPPPPAMGPWMLDPGATEVTVCWVTDEPSLGRVWYGQAQADHLVLEEGAPVTEHRVTVHGLLPATQYRYSVDGDSSGIPGLFTTAPEPGAEGPVQILVYGDNRTNN